MGQGSWSQDEKEWWDEHKGRNPHTQGQKTTNQINPTPNSPNRGLFLNYLRSGRKEKMLQQS